MESEVDQLRTDLERYVRLRASIGDAKTRELLRLLINETVERLREIERGERSNLDDDL